MSATRYFNRVWDAANGTMRQIEAGQRYEINADGSGTVFTWNGNVVCQFSAGHLLPCTGVVDEAGHTIYEGDILSEDGSDDMHLVAWHAGGFYLVPTPPLAGTDVDAVRVDAAVRMRVRGNVFQGLLA